MWKISFQGVSKIQTSYRENSDTLVRQKLRSPKDFDYIL